MLVRRLTFVSTALILGMLPLAAQTSPQATLTIALTGTLGPILRGNDPLGANGNTGSVTVVLSESISPDKVSGNSVMYTVPAGAITDVIGVRSYTTTTPGRLTVTLTNAADVLAIQYASRDNTITTVEAYLDPGSWSTSIFMHPGPFSPSPQGLKPATVANGPGTQLHYTFNGHPTVLAMDGTITNSSAANPQLPEIEQPSSSQ